MTAWAQTVIAGELDGLMDALAARHASAPLVALAQGEVLDRAHGYMPLLVNFTHEDKAAKGLRKLAVRDTPEPPVYFSALEMARDNATLLLHGEASCGKTSFALDLALHLVGKAGFSREGLQRQVARNDLGTVIAESYIEGDIAPIYLKIVEGQNFAALLARHWPDATVLLSGPVWEEASVELLVILDGLEAAGEAAASLLSDALAFQQAHARIRLLALGETMAVKALALSSPWVTCDLMPLLIAQRQDFATRTGVGLTPAALGPAAANPALFAAALSVDDEADTPEMLADAWLATVTTHVLPARRLAQAAFGILSGDLDIDVPEKLPLLANTRRLRQLLAARYLSERPALDAVECLRRQGDVWTPVIRSLAARLAADARPLEPLIDALLSGRGDDGLRGALIAAEFLDEPSARRDRVVDALLTLIGNGALGAPQRARGGRFLSRFGDPRDLMALADVPGGAFTFGSGTHPNSSPPHRITVLPFRIGRYPVTNAAYAEFVHDTGRVWRSPDGLDVERGNAPATDLTWHDACAFCDWLTPRWRREGRIGPDETVRLPSEPEWERAARGDQPDAGSDTIVYPWGGVWLADAANSEEAGFNSTCAVGLFPNGCSPYGCHDMAGQVWEWCTTLWGEDMATPHFAYPYRDDGREAAQALPSIRRVLRGGCFSSGKLKACSTYRGSLEPDGFWRGNGFRVVVAAHSPGK